MLRHVTILFCLASPAAAQVPLEGWLIATERCDAYQSKNALTNPGDVRLRRSFAYEMIGLNAPGGDWFQVRVPGAPVTADRWVSTACGIHVVEAGPRATDPVEPPPVIVSQGPESADNLLALSWQPAFCESKPTKTECQQLNDGLLPITETQLSLHGLWPQPRGKEYCGVPQALKDADTAGSWPALSAPEIDAETAERLAVAMPGMASQLDRHEWVKHGTCFAGAGGADEYYDDSLRVLDAINSGVIAELLAENVGAELRTDDLRAAFDLAFGEGAGDRVQVQCAGDQGRVLIQEIRITLKGTISEAGDIGALIRAGDPQTPGCPAGIVDPAGLQ